MIMEAPSNALSALRLMPSKDTEVANFSMQIIKAVQNGEANALEVLVMLRALEAVSELVREEIEDNVLNEADRYNEKVIERYGARIEKTEVGTRYNYFVTGDSEWERMNTEMQTLKRRLTERETFLKALKEPLIVVNADTGELETIKPPLKTSKQGIRVYLKHS